MTPCSIDYTEGADMDEPQDAPDDEIAPARAKPRGARARARDRAIARSRSPNVARALTRVPRGGARVRGAERAVSYTHLTLPTIPLV